MFASRLTSVPLRLSAQQCIRPMAFRAAAIAPFSTKTVTSPAQTKTEGGLKRAWFAAPPPPGKNMTPVKAAMPQLVPFYFVNEVTFAFTILPILIYIFSKYILPKNLRRYASRVFVSKL